MSDEIPAITMANNKQEMLAAYQQMKRLLAERRQAVLDAEREKEKFRQAASHAAAERAVAEDPVRRIQDLKATIGRELTALAEQFESETTEYVRLKEAVSAKQAELQRIYEVETAASDLAALIEAQRQRKSEFEAQIAEARSAWEKERADVERARKAEAELLDRQRTREREEYDYTIKREREQRHNALQDELATTEREIAARREAFEREATARDAQLREREQAVALREQHLDNLESRVAGFPEVVSAEVAKAVKDASDRLNADSRAREALLKKEAEGELNVLRSRIEGLQLLLERQTKQLDALTAQQEKAYAQVQDIASKAVESTRRSVVAVPAAARGTLDATED